MNTRRLVLLIAGVLFVSGCATDVSSVHAGATATVPPTVLSLATPAATTTTGAATTTIPVADSAPHATVTLALGGDVMLGRGLSRIVQSDPDGVFEDVRFLLSSVDIAGANMESPFTNRPHIATNPYALETPPETAELLATAGFDVLSIANNHAGDAGRASVTDSVEAISEAGMEAVGGGANATEAGHPAMVEVNGLRVGFLAYDATAAGTVATIDRPGITRWDEEAARAAVEALRPAVDLLVVAIHGGVEYREGTDPYLATIAERLHAWGVDVMWGSGPHVVQPVYVISGDRPTVVATSLGNLVFDQGPVNTKRGAILEVLGDAEGVVAYRLADVDHLDRRVHFDQWQLPVSTAAMVGGEWWTLARPVALEARDDFHATDFKWGDLIDASIGDIDLDGRDEVVAAFRRPFEDNPVNALFPEKPWKDAMGRSAHVGVFSTPGLRPEWIAGTLFEPVDRVVACDGSLAVGYVSDDGTPAFGGWRWQGFGFIVAPTLTWNAVVGCADVDGDGMTDPIVEQS